MAEAIETRKASVMLALTYDEAQLLANLVSAVDSEAHHVAATEIRDALEDANVVPDSTLRAVVAEQFGGPYVTYTDFWIEHVSDGRGV